jgi:hypothetical protein
MNLDDNGEDIAKCWGEGSRAGGDMALEQRERFSGDFWDGIAKTPAGRDIM